MMPAPLPLDTLVELRDEYTDVYHNTPVGARGWIRARRELPKTDPEVFIEWDKTHWRYGGEKDGWTFAHHFRAVARRDSPDSFDEHEIVRDAARQVAAEDPRAHALHAEYLDTLMDAQEAALSGDGFLMITLAPSQHGEYTIYEPRLFTRTLTSLADDMLDAQIMHMAAQLFQDELLRRVNATEGTPGEPR